MTAHAFPPACAPPAFDARLSPALPPARDPRVRASADIIPLPRATRRAAGAASEPAHDDMRRAFSQYVSPQVIERLMADPRLLNLGGETREMTVLFADVRGFTALSETMEDDPQRLIRLMNAILCPLSDIVLRHGGIIDKYMGDGLMAFWGAPVDDPEHAEHAVDAARAMVEAMVDVNASLRGLLGDGGELLPLKIGVGVNSGKCVVGNLGCEKRFDYSVIGDPVNVASRLEGLAKAYGVPLLIGEATAARLRRTPAFELDRISVRGRTRPQAVFTVP